MLVVEMGASGVVVAREVAARPVHERQHASPVCVVAELWRGAISSTGLENVKDWGTDVWGSGRSGGCDGCYTYGGRKFGVPVS